LFFQPFPVDTRVLVVLKAMKKQGFMVDIQG